jgi:hypothetical protein
MSVGVDVHVASLVIRTRLESMVAPVEVEAVELSLVRPAVAFAGLDLDAVAVYKMRLRFQAFA